MELPHDVDSLLSGIYLPKRNKTYVHTEMQNVAVSFVIASLVAQMVKKPACKAGDPGSIPGSGRSPGEENGNPFSFLVWKIPWTEEPGGLQSTGSQRVRHD